MSIQDNMDTVCWTVPTAKTIMTMVTILYLLGRQVVLVGHAPCEMSWAVWYCLRPGD